MRAPLASGCPLRRQDRLDDDQRLRLRQFEHVDSAGERNLDRARLVLDEAAVGESEDHRPGHDAHDAEELDRVVRLRSLHQPDQRVPGDPPVHRACAFLCAGPVGDSGASNDVGAAKFVFLPQAQQNVEPASLSEHCRDIDDRRAWNRHQPGQEPLLTIDRAGDMGAHRRIELRLDWHGEVVETGQHHGHHALGVPIFGRVADEGSDAGNRVHRFRLSSSASRHAVLSHNRVAQGQ
jgi:hypothetical protein